MSVIAGYEWKFRENCRERKRPTERLCNRKELQPSGAEEASSERDKTSARSRIRLS